ncbi:hypothetical protein CH341_12415 [Rhodoplanes roseus]|uniref:SPW repeat-containing integral membrane domain-containing protein n=1 Tax=Rhodoplanes roseus TaxID=29409 RepID=A0A327L017_9BRAD|nr:hypothetical protein CH341_12415 [Rhodoplanes roseus]
MIDYVVGVMLMASPYVLGFADGGAAEFVPVALGFSAVIYSLFTDYELGAIRAIPMPVHLGLDAASGIVLAASPWLFGFADQVHLPHLLFGLFEVAASLTTRTRPSSGLVMGDA